MATATFTTTVAGHHFPRRPPASTSKFSSFSSLSFFHLRSPFLHSSISFASSSAHLSTPSSQTPPLLCLERCESDEEEEREEGEVGEEEEQELEAASAAVLLPSLPCPSLTLKEKKELASYAHSLGNKLKRQQVGKSGVTPSVAASFIENLESNELLKIKVHGNCPMEFVDVVKQLEKATGSVAVAQIGRSVILYRPSISKLRRKESQGAKKVWKPGPRKQATYPGRQRRQLSRSSKSIGRRSG